MNILIKQTRRGVQKRSTPATRISQKLPKHTSCLPTDYDLVITNYSQYATPAGPHSISTVPTLAYLLRIEAGSPDKGTASDGGDMGATIIKRYHDGNLTDKDLWPYPYEARIKADMCETEMRGFCSATSLTQYIWEFLGNPLPSEYDTGGDTDTISPTPPTGLTIQQ